MRERRLGHGADILRDLLWCIERERRRRRRWWWCKVRGMREVGIAHFRSQNERALGDDLSAQVVCFGHGAGFYLEDAHAVDHRRRLCRSVRARDTHERDRLAFGVALDREGVGREGLSQLISQCRSCEERIAGRRETCDLAQRDGGPHVRMRMRRKIV